MSSRCSVCQLHCVWLMTVVNYFYFCIVVYVEQFPWVLGFSSHVAVRLIHCYFVHSGVKPYACTMCDMRFFQRYHLQRHSLTHTGRRNLCLYIIMNCLSKLSVCYRETQSVQTTTNSSLYFHNCLKYVFSRHEMIETVHAGDNATSSFNDWHFSLGNTYLLVTMTVASINSKFADY